MNPKSVVTLAAYALVDAGADHRFGNKNDAKIRIRSATYNSATHTVTLLLKKPVIKGHSLKLTVVARAPLGPLDSEGRVLNLASDGTPGADYTVYLGQLPKGRK